MLFECIYLEDAVKSSTEVDFVVECSKKEVMGLGKVYGVSYGAIYTGFRSSSSIDEYRS